MFIQLSLATFTEFVTRDRNLNMGKRKKRMESIEYHRKKKSIIITIAEYRLKKVLDPIGVGRETEGQRRGGGGGGG